MTTKNFENTPTLSSYGESIPSPSSSDLIGGSIKNYCQMDTPAKPEYDRGESGRSMVEMLGTLAIVGVLSIGGIAGYSYGMDKYRANETINDVNLRGIDLVAQVSMGRATLSLSDWPTVSKAGYDISEPVLSAEGDAYFTISGVPKRVCEMVYDGIMQNQTTDVEINGYVVDDSSTCGDDNIMGFFFITNAGEGGTNPEELCDDVGCPEGLSCTHGICMSEEVPPINSNGVRYCNKDEECRECEYCKECLYCSTKGQCTKKDDGSYCRNYPNKVCMNGYCIEDKTCTDNSECNYGYYCGKKDDNTKMCIKAEFYKLTLNTGEEFYLSQERFSDRPLEDAQNMCDSIGLQLVDDISKREDIINNIWDFSDDNESIQILSEAIVCQISFRDYYSCWTQVIGHPVCVKENKVYSEKETEKLVSTSNSPETTMTK